MVKLNGFLYFGLDFYHTTTVIKSWFDRNKNAINCNKATEPCNMAMKRELGQLSGKLKSWCDNCSSEK